MVIFIRLAATPALSQELQEMAVNFKTGLFSKTPFQLSEVAIGKINNLTAVGADEVMVMFRGAAHQVAAATAAGMRFTDKTKLREDFNGAIDSYQADARMLFTHPFMNCGGGAVFKGIDITTNKE